MKRNADRILTTHAGSLPRPESLLSLVLAHEAGETMREAEFDAELRSAVKGIVQKQADSEIDVVNDGELSKPSYATYPKDRLTGFGGEGSLTETSNQVVDLSDHPDFAEQMTVTMDAATKVEFVTCDGPVSFQGQEAVQKDIDNLKAAQQGLKVEGAFMSAASPGVISVFSPNRYYPSEEHYLEAIADAMRQEYEAIHRAGILLQLDCPDFAMTAPGAGSVAEHRRLMEMRVEALNHAVSNIPAEAMRVHVCWGNLEMPRDTDVPLRDIVDIIFKAKPAGIMVMASNGRHEHEWKVFRDVTLPDGKYLIPGVLDSTSNVIEHPEVVADRLIHYAEVVGKENVMAGTDCGFGTVAGMHIVAPSVVWAKFQAMAEGARIASRQLW